MDVLLRKGDRSARDGHGLCLLPEGVMNSTISFALQRCQGWMISDRVTPTYGGGEVVEEAVAGGWGRDLRILYDVRGVGTA